MDLSTISRSIPTIRAANKNKFRRREERAVFAGVLRPRHHSRIIPAIPRDLPSIDTRSADKFDEIHDRFLLGWLATGRGKNVVAHRRENGVSREWRPIRPLNRR